MAAPQDQGVRRPADPAPSASPKRVIVGFILMSAGVALMSYGAHFAAKTGTCSGTGYVSYGPVARCGPDEALYITSAFFLGPLAAVLGWLIGRSSGWLWPGVCLGVGAGLITIGPETTASTGARAFGVVGGVCLFGLAGLSVIGRLRKRRKVGQASGAAGPGTAVLASRAAPTLPARPPSAGTRAAAADRADPLATIARLAQLRDAGALTGDEFEFQKAKLLAEI